MPIKDVFRRRKYDRERKQRQREDAKRQEQIRKLQKELGDILPVTLATYESFQKTFPSSSYKLYLQELKRFKLLKKPKKKGFPLEFQVKEYPLQGDECIKFRAMICGLWVKDPFFCANHDVICENCNQWRIANKGLYKPTKLW